MTLTEVRDGLDETAGGMATPTRTAVAPTSATASPVVGPGVDADEVGDIRRRLVRLLQDAHAGELAAAYAYRAHARSLWRRTDQRDEVHRIELAEWHHRRLVAEMLVDLGARPRRRRELLMGATGRFFGILCFVTGWFGPMYAAGRLEAMNVDQYRVARDLAAAIGLDLHAAQLELMRLEEVRHENWFGDRVRGHFLLPLARALLGWSPPDTAG